MSNDTTTIRTATHTASGSSISIHPYGATLLSFKAKGGTEEVLFVSKHAKLDASKPIRGGVPLVFPIFGPDTKGGRDMPQHGYARRNTWTCVETYDRPDAAGMVWELQSPSDVRDGLGTTLLPPPPCTLRYTAECTSDTLTTVLTVVASSSSSVPFQALLHTYYRVPNALDTTSCYVKGLEGYTVSDKVTKEAPYVNTVTSIGITAETDRVYDPPAVSPLLAVQLGTNRTITAHGVVNGVDFPVSCVVWNPYVDKAKAMRDFGDDEYTGMICVEPGILGDTVVLEPGQEASLTQTIRLV